MADFSSLPIHAKQIKRLTCLSILFFAGLILFLISNHRSIQEHSSYNVVLSIQWPPTLCHSISQNSPNQKCKPNIPVNQWLIHGLWPQLVQHDLNQKPNYSPFVLEKIESLQDQLHVDWVNLLRGETDQSFWAREWEKHGTCSPFDQYDYFDKTIVLFRHYSVDRFLARGGILPNNNILYSVEQFQQALKPLMESEENFYFKCSKQKGGKLLVQEIRLCFRLDKSRPENGGFSPNKCSLTKSNCGSSFYFIS